LKSARQLSGWSYTSTHTHTHTHTHPGQQAPHSLFHRVTGKTRHHCNLRIPHSSPSDCCCIQSFESTTHDDVHGN